jgi:hypothetical protein
MSITHSSRKLNITIIDIVQMLKGALQAPYRLNYMKKENTLPYMKV